MRQQRYRRLSRPPEDMTCWNCKAPLSGRRRHYCSSECGELYWKKGNWEYTRKLVFKRDNNTCQLCKQHEEVSLLQVDHIIPIANGGDELNVDNLRTLCVVCHKKVTAEWRKERANSKALLLIDVSKNA